MEFNKNQLKAINHYKGNCCVLASAGSGKTTVLVNRIVNLINTHNLNHNKILAITFSRKATTNMINKLNNIIPNNNVDIYTFHALGCKILKETGYYRDIIKDWEKRDLINNIVVKSLNVESNKDDVYTNDILTFISYQKNYLNEPSSNELIELNDSPYDLDTMREIYRLYEKQKTKIDFEDMLLNSHNILLKNKYNNPYEYILVDEFQDTNKAQYEMIKLLGTHNNVFVVGDPLQNIFEWRGSNNNYLINFYKDWVNPKIINLNINYRSTKDIVIYSNQLVKNTIETTHKHYIESVSNKDNFKAPVFNVYKNEQEEAINICEEIKQLINDYDYKDIAILTRTNFQMQVIERSLYNSNIPYAIVDGNKFYELKEIKDMIAYLRLINDTSNNEAFLQIYNSPNRYFGSVFLNDVQEYAKKHKLSLFISMQEYPRSNEWRYKKGINKFSKIIYSLKDKKYSVGKTIKIIREKLDYDKYISKDNYENNDRNEKVENLDAFMNSANNYEDISEFLNEIDNILGFNDEDNKNKVSLMTIHKAKGLEFPVVFVVGVSNGLLPHKKSDNINEERRLLYVATTRAEKELFISSVEYYYDKYLGVSDFL